MGLQHAVNPVWRALTYMAVRIKWFVGCMIAIATWCARKVHGSFWTPSVALVHMMLSSVVNGVMLYVVLKKILMESGVRLPAL